MGELIGPALQQFGLAGGVAIVLFYLFYTRKIILSGEVDKVEVRHAAEVEKTDARHAEHVKELKAAYDEEVKELREQCERELAVYAERLSEAHHDRDEWKEHALQGLIHANKAIDITRTVVNDDSK